MYGFWIWERNAIRPAQPVEIPSAAANHFGVRDGYIVRPPKQDKPGEFHPPTLCGLNAQGRAFCQCNDWTHTGKACQHIWSMTAYRSNGPVNSFDARVQSIRNATRGTTTNAASDPSPSTRGAHVAFPQIHARTDERVNAVDAELEDDYEFWGGRFELGTWFDPHDIAHHKRRGPLDETDAPIAPVHSVERVSARFPVEAFGAQRAGEIAPPPSIPTVPFAEEPPTNEASFEAVEQTNESAPFLRDSSPIGRRYGSPPSRTTNKETSQSIQEAKVGTSLQGRPAKFEPIRHSARPKSRSKLPESTQPRTAPAKPFVISNRKAARSSLRIGQTPRSAKAAGTVGLTGSRNYGNQCYAHSLLHGLIRHEPFRRKVLDACDHPAGDTLRRFVEAYLKAETVDQADLLDQFFGAGKCTPPVMAAPLLTTGGLTPERQLVSDPHAQGDPTELFLRLHEQIALDQIWGGSSIETFACPKCGEAWQTNGPLEPMWLVHPSESSDALSSCLSGTLRASNGPMRDCAICGHRASPIRRDYLASTSGLAVHIVWGQGQDGRTLLPASFFSLDEDLRFGIDPSDKSSRIHWQLQSIVCHQGVSPQEGHYVLLTRHENDWFIINNENVSPLQGRHSDKAFEGLSRPLVLFYSRDIPPSESSESSESSTTAIKVSHSVNLGSVDARTSISPAPPPPSGLSEVKVVTTLVHVASSNSAATEASSQPTDGLHGCSSACQTSLSNVAPNNKSNAMCGVEGAVSGLVRDTGESLAKAVAHQPDKREARLKI